MGLYRHRETGRLVEAVQWKGGNSWDVKDFLHNTDSPSHMVGGGTGIFADEFLDVVEIPHRGWALRQHEGIPVVWVLDELAFSTSYEEAAS